MIKKMKYWLHEDKGGFLEQIDGSDLYDSLSDEALKQLNYAFYEVELEINLNTKTGEIEILGAK